MDYNYLKARLNILIVDDDPLSIFLSERLLTKHYFTHSVKSGHEALSLLQEKEFDLVLMDINLGDINMDGIKTMRKIRENQKTKSLLIFALTAFSHNKKWYLDQGFNDLYIKPLNSDIFDIIDGSFINNQKVA